jgi:hypothetical protein
VRVDSPLAGAFVHSGAESRPRDKVRRGREAAHVVTNLREYDGCRGLADSVYGHEVLDDPTKGPQAWLRLLLDVADRTQATSQRSSHTDQTTERGPVERLEDLHRHVVQ